MHRNRRVALARSLFRSVLLLSLLCATVAWAQHARKPDPSNLLTNPGFETGDFTGWTVSGNSPNFGVNVAGFSISGADYPTILLVHSGTYAGYAIVCGLYCDEHLDLSQTVSLVPGATYWTGFWLGDGTNQSFGNEVNISVDGVPILLIYFSQVEPGYQFVGGVFAASNPHSVIDFYIRGSGPAMAGFSFDDFCISANAVTCQNPYTFQTIIFPGDTFTETLGINNAELIAGYHGSGGSEHPNQGFVLTLPDNFTAENFPGALQTQVIAINNAGNTAGSYVDQNGATHGFVNIGGTFTTVDFPATTFNQLLGLNDANEAAGYWQDDQGNQSPYTYQGGVFTSIDSSLPPHFSAQASGVNNASMVTGTYYEVDGYIHGFLLNGTSVTTLDYPGAYYTYAMGLNNAGQVVGSYYNDQGITHGFVYGVGSQQFQNYNNPYLPYGNLTINGINDSGQIVGFYADANGDTDGFVGTPRTNAHR